MASTDSGESWGFKAEVLCLTPFDAVLLVRPRLLRTREE
jgi:hypothetical protein